jgi:Leucine rich repeat
MATCEGANAFFNPDTPRGTTAGRRRLIAGAMMEIPRLTGSVFDSKDDCLKACVGYPRPTNPADYLEPESIGINSIGDTFWCRNTHLKIAERTKREHFGAQTHCPFASPSGGGLCNNVILDTDTGFNATAYEFERAGASSSRHIGFCQMYFNDLVADCTSAGIDDVNFDLVLALIPTETEVLILNNNVGKRDPVTGNTLGSGITIIKDEQFRGLLCPSCIKALIMDDGNIETVSAGSFTALRFLQSLSLNMQKISFLPSGLLQNNPDLREFSMYNTRVKQGKLEDGSIPSNLFTEAATAIARIVISGHKGLTALPAGIFGGLTNLSILILSNNGLTNEMVPEDSFSSLTGLQIWDMSGNQFQRAPAAWLSSGWANSLTNFYLYMNPLEELEDGIFDNFSEGFCRLEVVLLHDTDLKTVNIGTFDFCQDTLISYTLSNRV